jgi:hypothetical protein
MVPNSGEKAHDLGVDWPSMINEKHALALEGGFLEKNMSPFGFKVRAFSDWCDVADLRGAVDCNSPLSRWRRTQGDWPEGPT